MKTEVEMYDQDVFRRLYVKPGITGIWQISGRNSLSWEDTVRMDLFYVENWSPISDALIVLKTLKAVFRGTGY
jgi:lipopolysaccharide/colanic/teichoic acid biosynthesis glycosyltransferase